MELRPLLIKIFAPVKVHLLEIAGIRDAFFEANCKMASGDRYRVQLVTEEGVVAASASVGMVLAWPWIVGLAMLLLSGY